MQITNQSVYAVDTMLHMAAGDRRRPCTARGIAEVFGKSTSYTEQIFAKLRAADLVRSQRAPAAATT